jgi:hypothetical protein
MAGSVKKNTTFTKKLMGEFTQYNVLK